MLSDEEPSPNYDVEFQKCLSDPTWISCLSRIQRLLRRTWQIITQYQCTGASCFFLAQRRVVVGRASGASDIFLIKLTQNDICLWPSAELSRKRFILFLMRFFAFDGAQISYFIQNQLICLNEGRFAWKVLESFAQWISGRQYVTPSYRAPCHPSSTLTYGARTLPHKILAGANTVLMSNTHTIFCCLVALKTAGLSAQLLLKFRATLSLGGQRWK